jgi:hypothetical protein
VDAGPRKTIIMNDITLDTNILEALRRPFHPSQITWKPGAIAKSSDKALALAYGDLRAYQNRLDEVCGANWSVSYTPWGERIICNLTIYGITRASTGEGDGDSERNEIAGTVAEAQAFKRACAMFGLGRYLYSLPSVWAEWDKERKAFSDAAKSKLLGLLMDHYRRAGGEIAGETGDKQPATNADLRRQVDELGQALYGDTWPQVCTRNCKRISGGAVEGLGELKQAELQKLLTGLQKLQRQREAA